MAAKNDPDDRLARENDRVLNEAFYATRPFEYFEQRLQTLLLVAGKGSELDALLQQGVSFDGLNAQARAASNATEEKERGEARDRYVIAETAVLLHHVAETLLRLFLSHEQLPPCPWLAMAKETNFRRFKQAVDDLGDDLANHRRHDGLATVFFGAANRESLHPTPPANEWKAGIENLAAWLGFFAEWFLDANVYNAAKHGLALRPGDSSVTLGGQHGANPILQASGPSLEYVEIATDESGRRYWQRTTRWISVGRSLGHVSIATRLMRCLWGIARARYVDERLSGIDLFNQPRLTDVFEEGVQTTGLSVPLTYYAEE